MIKEYYRQIRNRSNKEVPWYGEIGTYIGHYYIKEMMQKREPLACHVADNPELFYEYHIKKCRKSVKVIIGMAFVRYGLVLNNDPEGVWWIMNRLRRTENLDKEGIDKIYTEYAKKHKSKVFELNI